MKQSNHWGEWIDQRSRAVGFKRQGDFAQAVGCGRTQLAKWIALQSPPPQMRKGFDVALATALKIDRAVLFIGYRSIAPDVDMASLDAATATRRRVLAMVELMPNDGLKELARVGEQILHKGMLQVA